MKDSCIANRVAKGYINRIYHSNSIRGSFKELRKDSSAFFRCIVSLGFIDDIEIYSSIDKWSDAEYEDALAKRGSIRLDTKAYSDGNIVFAFDGNSSFYIEEGVVRLHSLPSSSKDILEKDWEILF